jgi:parvulin-like peptidyl-prolyl isomerase
MRTLTAILISFISFLSLAAGARAEPVDHIVAAVNNEVITASELAQTAGLNERLGKSVRDRKTLETETLEGLITRRLLVQEARRLRFVEVSEQEINAEVEKLGKRFESDAAFMDFLRSLDLTEQELGRMLGEQLLVEKFAEKKVGLFVRVTREEAQSYFDGHASQFPEKRFQDVQKKIIAALTDQKVGQQLDKYVAELRGRADIRMNPS